MALPWPSYQCSLGSVQGALYLSYRGEVRARGASAMLWWLQPPASHGGGYVMEEDIHVGSARAAGKRRAHGLLLRGQRELGDGLSLRLDDIHCDVAVVGGGFSGVNTALELAERGRDVVLLEAHRISWGASGRNGGQIIGGIGHDPERFVKAIGEDGVRTIYQMGLEAREVIRERIDTYDIDCDLKWGYCDVALKPRHMKQFAEWREFEKRIGNPHPTRCWTARNSVHS
jgi:hypothetical protein